MMTSGMYASSTCEWETPQALFDRLDAAYHFECDVCATAENAKCAKYYDRETDGLKQTWTGVCWMNPPYGREIGKWMSKAYASAQAGAWFFRIGRMGDHRRGNRESQGQNHSEAGVG